MMTRFQERNSDFLSVLTNSIGVDIKRKNLRESGGFQTFRDIGTGVAETNEADAWIALIPAHQRSGHPVPSALRGGRKNQLPIPRPSNVHATSALSQIVPAKAGPPRPPFRVSQQRRRPRR